MRTFQIQNEELTVKIENLGAQLLSVRDSEGTEYLWQGNPAYWEDRSPILFPYIARLTEGKYRLFGNTYHMDIHGFAKDTVFEPVEKTETKIVLRMHPTETTYEQYPYQFDFTVTYELDGARLCMSLQVDNKDEKVMYFGLGGHPGLNVPYEKDTIFEDYQLVFDEETDAKRVGMSEDCFVTGEEIEYPLVDNKILPLEHHLFDHDAVIFHNMPKGITITSPKAKKSVHVTYPDVSYLGLWHAVETDAPYVCIEPWSSLPSRKGVIEDLSDQPGIVSLESGQSYRSRIGIEIRENY